MDNNLRITCIELLLRTDLNTVNISYNIKLICVAMYISRMISFNIELITLKTHTFMCIYIYMYIYYLSLYIYI